MPKVKKLTAGNRKKKSSSNVLDRITPVGSSQHGIKLCVYGRGKTGKTRFASTFPKPLLIIGTEDGTMSLGRMKGVNFVRVQSSNEIEELANTDHKSFVLDTAGGLQDMILKEILGLDELPMQKTWGLAQMQHWQTCAAQTKQRLTTLLNLAELSNRSVVIIAHERSFGDDSEKSNSDLDLLPQVGAALTPSAAGWLNGECDYICQTFIREATKITKVAGKEKLIPDKTKRPEYCLRIGPHPIFMTGFRHPPNINLPDVIVDASYQKVKKLIDGES